ncbi:RES domain-containing protein [Flavobacterium psychrophilum]|uniref:RES domain-containing protein n=1 Tax=Flavobacterium psychrophilum TaxID=96345 RepID=UPI000B7C39ED|nr:RES domain-containing protein [Flavobacterium psychrophilum]MBF2025101.1 RES domain-containing protein [Flavobacterium psychrophilum]MCB5984409.1 RES domain-containing protein [Flavobacterium psychrophilum]MCB5995520.1 RES domain-containing protein [Flavobacterium psychrophilum]MCB5997912.1 RES domain-containing protein [Flavobacterium psychrophilum]MCB6005423.1 RES domain-containing protein [Flavobacterium psychrophilum]
MNYKEIPSLNKVQRALRKFEKTEWPIYEEGKDINKFVEEVSKIITSELGIFMNYLMPLKHKEFTFSIFRAREVDSFKNIDLFTEHSYPPPSITKFGRCNFPNNPVFYSSNNPMTAILEVIRNGEFVGKKFCISLWKINNAEETLIFENFLQTELHPKNPFSELAESAKKKVGEPFENKINERKKKGIIEFMKFIDTQFINDLNYSLSAALAHRRLYARDNYCTDILLYPSVQSFKQGVNLAINPNFVDNHLQIQRCYLVELKSYDKHTGKFSVTLYKYGDVIKNRIFWKNIDPNNNDYNKNFKEDFKDMIEPNEELIFEKNEI